MGAWPCALRYSSWCRSQVPSDQRLELRLGAEIVESGIHYVDLRLVESFLRCKQVYNRGCAQPVALLLHPQVFSGSGHTGLGNLNPCSRGIQLSQPRCQFCLHFTLCIGGVGFGQIELCVALHDTQLTVEPAEEVPAQGQTELALIEQIVVRS